MNNLAGIVISLLYVGLVLGLSALLQRRGAKPEASRKLVHILLGGWWVLAMVFFTSPLFAAAVPTVFVAVNAWAYRRGRLAAIQRPGGENTPGTVYYALSLLVLALFCFGAARPYMGALGVLCMSFGDGFAALVGARSRRGRLRLWGGEKSLAGIGAMFLCSYLACWIILALYDPPGRTLAALVLALLATGLESASPKGLDNLTVPLGVTGFYYAVLYAPAAYRLPVMGALLSLAVVLAAWGKGLLTLPAGLGAILVGAVIYAAGGWAMWVLLIWFFVSSTLAARLAARRAKAAARHSGGPRRLVQVLANSLPCAVFSGWAWATGNGWLLLAAAAALAACTADTWASEIGVYSNAPPVNILGLRPMQRGLSGGVSPLGLGAGAVGAGCSALLAMGLFRLTVSPVPTGPWAFFLVFGLGFAGCVLDSVLGALAQAKYRYPGNSGMVEAPPAGVKNYTLASGIRWVNNDMVNLLSGFAAAALALPAVL